MSDEESPGSLSDNLELPTQELRDAAFRMFGETKASRANKLAELRLLVQKIPHCEVFDTSDSFLIRYLRGKALQVDVAAKAIESYFQLCLKHPEWTQNLTAREFSSFKSVLHILKARDKEGRILLLLSVKNFIKVFTPEFIEENPFAMIRFNFYCSYLMSMNHNAQVYGLWVLGFCAGMTVKDARVFAQIAPFHERLAFNQYQICGAPLRTNGYYCFEEPRYMRWYWNIAYNFITSPLKKNVHMCGSNYSKLHEIIDDVSLLPTSLGGKQQIPGMKNTFLRTSNSPSNDGSGDEKPEDNTNQQRPQSTNNTTSDKFRPSSSIFRAKNKVVPSN